MCAYTERKGFSSITSKLSRMVGHLKRKRKTHTSPAFSPLPKPSKIPHIASHTPSRRPSTFSTPHSSPLHIHDAPRSAPVSPQRILHIDPHPQKKDLPTHPPPPLHSNPSPLSASVAPCRCRGEHSVHRTFSVVILLALLCTFLCIGKEIAFVIATAAHLILQLALGLGLLARRPTVNYAAQASFHDHMGFDNSAEDNIVGSNGHTCSLNRSSIISCSSGHTFVTSLQGNRRSKSWTKLYGSMKGEMQPRMASDSADSTSSERVTISSPRRRNLSAKLKLHLWWCYSH